VIQLVLFPRISFVVWLSHVSFSTRMLHLETKETHSCTSTNPIRTLEKKQVQLRDQITFPLLDWKLLGCFPLYIAAFSGQILTMTLSLNRQWTNRVEIVVRTGQMEDAGAHREHLAAAAAWRAGASGAARPGPGGPGLLVPAASQAPA
jgi:hypothetical protein